MRKFFGLDETMLWAERVPRLTICLSLIIMMLAPLPLIFILGAGPFAFIYPLLIISGFYTLRGTCRKVNLFHYIFLVLCMAVTMSVRTNVVIAVLLPIILFCFLLYFQAERRLYYLLELTKNEGEINDLPQNQKKNCKIYFLNCCKNAILPAFIGSIAGYVIVLSAGSAWLISGIFLIVSCGIYIFLLKYSR